MVTTALFDALVEYLPPATSRTTEIVETFLDLLPQKTGITGGLTETLLDLHPDKQRVSTVVVETLLDIHPPKTFITTYLPETIIDKLGKRNVSSAVYDQIVRYLMPQLTKGKQIQKLVAAGEGLQSDHFDAGGIKATAYGRGIFAANLFDNATIASIVQANAIPTSKLVDAAEFLMRDGSVALTGDLPAGNNKITGLADGVAPGDAINRGQLSAALLGLSWQDPVDVANYVGNRSVAQINALVPTGGDAYVVEDAGVLISGALAVTAGDLVEFDGAAWVTIVTAVGGFPPLGTRALVTTGTPVSPLIAGDKGKEATFDGASLTPALASPLAGYATVVRGPGAFNEGQQFTFKGTVPTGTWVMIGTTAVPPKLAIVDKDLSGVTTVGDNQATGLTVTAPPLPASYFGVLVNHSVYHVGDGVKTTDCYFSDDGGATAKSQGSIVAGDQLIWNGVISGHDLIASDSIDFAYLRT